MSWSFNPQFALSRAKLAQALLHIIDVVTPDLKDPAATTVLERIVRQTIGYRKYTDIMAYCQLQTWTGLCLDTLARVIKLLLKKQLIARRRVGKSYKYYPLFVEKLPTLSHDLPTTPDAQSSFFDQQHPDKTETQIAFTERVQKEEEIERVVDVINNDLENRERGYALKNAPYLAKRARALGMTPADLYALWRDCVRHADKPPAFLLWTMSRNGKPPKAIPKKPRNASAERFYAMLHSA